MDEVAIVGAQLATALTTMLIAGKVISVTTLFMAGHPTTWIICAAILIASQLKKL